MVFLIWVESEKFCRTVECIQLHFDLKLWAENLDSETNQTILL